jgi:hypothetical protein
MIGAHASASAPPPSAPLSAPLSTPLVAQPPESVPSSKLAQTVSPPFASKTSVTVPATPAVTVVVVGAASQVAVDPVVTAEHVEANALPEKATLPVGSLVSSRSELWPGVTSKFFVTVRKPTARMLTQPTFAGTEAICARATPTSSRSEASKPPEHAAKHAAKAIVLNSIDFMGAPQGTGDACADGCAPRRRSAS